MNISAAIAPAGATHEKTPDVEFRGVSKLYGEVRAVDGVDMRLRRGAFVSLLDQNLSRRRDHGVDRGLGPRLTRQFTGVCIDAPDRHRAVSECE